MELQLQPGEQATSSHGGEVFSCAYSPDGAFVLSAGWDGHLRLWEASSGAHISALSASGKPLSACTLSTDGRHWLSGALDGMLTTWDPMARQPISTFLAHTRPLSTILFTYDGKKLITASWDRSVIVWTVARERESQTLAGHEDIVAGCRISPDNRTLLSWSHDRTLRTWDISVGRALNKFVGHRDRVTAGAISPDGVLAASGSRDRTVCLWELSSASRMTAATVGAEVRGCFFQLDGSSLVVVDQQGRVTWHALPSLEVQTELLIASPVQCAEMSPSGAQLVLGCDDGQLRFVTLHGFEENPLVVTPTQSKRRTRTMLDRLFGRSRLTDAYTCICPACGRTFDLPTRLPGQPATCPSCRRNLRLSNLMRIAPE